jgi:hypothetical protein
MRKIVLGTIAWIAAISAVHLAVNVNWETLLNDRLPEQKRKLNVAYVPVT